MLSWFAATTRRLFLGAVAVPSCLSAAVPPAPAPGTTAYDYALRCYVANLVIKDRASARVAFEAAVKVGRSQGFTNERLNADFEKAPYTEARLVADKTFLQQSLGACRTLGLAR